MKIGDIFDSMINEAKGNTYSYGCVMLDLKLSKTDYDKIQGEISEDDLYKGTKEDPGYGREDEPHVTLLYGIHSDVPDSDVEKIIDKITQPTIKLNKIDIFDNKDKGFDVVKFNIVDKSLTKMNDLLKTLPYTSDYDEYHAHATIAYVKAGKGESYVRDLTDDEIIELKPSGITYSKADGSKKKYKFKG